MSDTPFGPALDTHAILAKLDRDRAETEKLFAEAIKLRAEGRKFNRDLWIVPFTVIGAIIAAIMARLPEILHAFGVGQ